MARLLIEAPPAGSGAPADSLNSDMILILAGLLCALVCVLGLGLVARCACSRRWAAAARAPPGEAVANKGVKKEVLRSLPTVTYVPDGSKPAGEGADECAICLAEFEDGQAMRVLPQCGHAFHTACVDTWLRALLLPVLPARARRRAAGRRAVPPLRRAPRPRHQRALEGALQRRGDDVLGLVPWALSTGIGPRAQAHW